MIKKIIYGLLVVSVLGCAAESEENDNGTFSFEKNPCVSANASYLVSFTEISGDCGPIPDQVLVVPADGVITIEASCNKGPRYSGCSVFLENMVCTYYNSEYDVNVTETQSGQVTWAEDGSSGKGMVTWRISAEGYYPCTSTYEYNAVRL